jgi:hypothetical protein
MLDESVAAVGIANKLVSPTNWWQRQQSGLELPPKKHKK